MNRPTRRKLRERNSPAANRLHDMARRLAVKITGEFWQLLGYSDGVNDEVFDEIEMFQGIGFRSRPKADSDAEVIVINLGESSHPVGVATRDKAIEISLAEDETAIFNATGAKCHVKADGSALIENASGARCRINADGSIDITAGSGKTVSIDDGSGAVPLATKADLDALALHVDVHLHGGVTAGSVVSGVPSVTSPVATGTTVLEGK